MNREIKFRAWDKKRNRMISEIRNIDFALGKIMSEYDVDIVDGQNSGNYFRGFEHISLMEFTGLKDKKGNKIYEGDIVIINEEDDEWYDVVVRDKNWLELKNYKNRCVTNISLYEWHKKIRIVGNIFENPDLIISQK